MESWAIGGVDLLVPLVPVDGRRGLRASLEEAIREAVRTGRLPSASRLPSSRSLAADLGLARNTVAEVYSQLIAEGYLTGRAGAGTFVAHVAGPVASQAPGRLGAGGPWLDSGRAPAAPGHDLRCGSPDLSLFPRAAWLAATRRVLATAPHDAFGYSDPRGHPGLRRALAAYLARVRGVRADPELVVVVGGHMQGVGLLARVLAARGGRRIALESPGLPYLPALVRRCGLADVALPVDDAGARTDLLTGLGVDAVALTPAHQFPTGALLGPARRSAALGWGRSGGLLIEDDYDGEFRLDRQPVGALQGRSPERTVYVGTASKSLAPGVRMGWLVLPADLAADVAEEKFFADHHAPAMDQLVLAELITSGAYDRQVRRARLVYRRRRDQLVQALAERAPAVRLTGMAAGLQAVLRLPAGTDAPALVERAARAGLAVEDLAQYGPGAVGPALVVGYGTPSGHAFAGALDALCSLLGTLGP